MFLWNTPSKEFIACVSHYFRSPENLLKCPCVLSHVRLFANAWSLPGSSVHEIFQARILKWVAISFSRGSSRPRDQTQVSGIAGRFFPVLVTSSVQLSRSVVSSFLQPHGLQPAKPSCPSPTPGACSNSCPSSQ